MFWITGLVRSGVGVVAAAAIVQAVREPFLLQTGLATLAEVEGALEICQRGALI